MTKMIGMQLRQARQERGLTLEEAAQTTRIKIHYLRLLEAGEFSSLPSKAQARGFLRSYASYLELDANNIISDLDQDGSVDQEALDPIIEPARPVEVAPQPQKKDETASTIRVTYTQVETVEEQRRSSHRYFVEIGQQLSRQRELLGLNFEEIERHTRLRGHFLKALEAGNFHDLPSPVQGRGMLNNYATFLGLDPEPILLKFAEGLREDLAIRKAASQPGPKTKPKAQPSRSSGRISLDLLIGGVIGLLMLGFVVWGGLRILSTREKSQEVIPTAPSIAEVLLATPTATTTPTIEPVSMAPPATLTLPAAAIVTDSGSGEVLTGADQGNVQVQLSVKQRTWMRILVDGKTEFDGRVTPGSALTFAGNDMIEILTGNGEALQVVFNGQDIGILGGYGEVVNLIFNAQGIIFPTPTISPTPSKTPEIPVIPTQTLPPTTVQNLPTAIPGTPVLP